MSGKPLGNVIGIGASAGGLEPVKSLVKQIHKTRDQDHAFLLIIHQNDRFESHLLEILAPDCALPVKWAEEGELIKAGMFYLCPAQHDVWVQEEKISFVKGQKSIPGPSVDKLLTSLALCYQNRTVAIILSGSGQDGATGSCAVAQAGGLVFTQLLNEAQYPQMPEACLRKCPEAVAVSTLGLLDEINKKKQQLNEETQQSTLAQLKQHTAQLLKNNWKIAVSWIRPSWQEPCWSAVATKLSIDPNSDSPLSEQLKTTFAQQAIGHLLEHQDAFFFNHPLFGPFSKWLANKINPHTAETPIRIWVPFAGTAELAYSISICIQTLLDKQGKYRQVQIFTSDLSDEKIEQARKGLFSKSQIASEVPEEMRTYFKQTSDLSQYEVSQEVKSRIIFSPHNPFSDPPFLHLDLIASGSFFNRLNQEARLKIRDVFAYSLKKDGILLLEDSNWLDFSPGPFKSDASSPYLLGLEPLIPINNQYRPHFKGKENWYNELIHQFSHQQSQQQVFQPATIPERYYVILDQEFKLKYLSYGLTPLFHLPHGAINHSIFGFLHEKLETEIKAQLEGQTHSNIKLKPSFRKLVLNDGKTYFVRARVESNSSKLPANEGHLLAFDLLPESDILSEDPQENWEAQTEKHEYESELQALKIRLAQAEEALSKSVQIQLNLEEELKNSYGHMQQIQDQLAGSNEELASSNEELKVAYQELKLIYSELQIKEQKLEIAHNRLQDLISNSFQPYLQLNSQYIVELFNSKAGEIFYECTNESLTVGQSLLHYLKGDSLHKFLKYFKNTLSGQVERGEFLMTDLSGRRRHFYFTATPMPNEWNVIEHVLFNFLDFSDLNEIKEELEERNQLIENVFKVVDVGLVVTDSNGLIITCNESAANLIDLTREQLIGRLRADVIQLNQLDNLILDPSSLDSKKNLYELKLQEGKYKLVQATTRQIELQEDSLQVLSLLDITDKIKYLNLLEDTQTAAHVGGWEFDILNNRFEITEEVKRILPSISISSLTLEKSFDLLSEESRYRFKKQIPALLNGLIILEEDIQLNLHNNLQVWLHIVAKPFLVNGQVRKVIGTVQDITEKKISELELKKLSLVASKTHNAVIITNNNQEIEWVNDGFEKLTSYTFEEVIGQNPKMLQGKDTDKETAKRIGEKLINKEPLTETILNYHKNGTPYWIELTITPVLDSKGQIEKFISIESDVTHEKNIEQQQQLLLQELTRQNQELLRFSYITSHNLRAPLANILGLLNLMDKNRLSSEEDQYIVDGLFESANSLNSTLQDLVDSLHHKTEGDKEKSLLSIQDLCLNVKRLFQNQLNEAKAEIHTDFENCPLIYWNKNYLNSVLQNLLSNSLKYRKLDQPLQLDVSLKIENEEPVIYFKDNGQGFDAARYHDRLFGLYQRFNTQVEGKGLGLFIVNSQVKSLGGHIEVISKPGEGALFKVYLGKNALSQ